MVDMAKSEIARTVSLRNPMFYGRGDNSGCKWKAVLMMNVWSVEGVGLWVCGFKLIKLVDLGKQPDDQLVRDRVRMCGFTFGYRPRGPGSI